jgi:peptidoglycan/xylan/chitin deacetylase (PgdA/CDA1 family)
VTALARTLGDRLLRVPRVVKRAPGRPPAIALTFDDGPSQWTQQIAGALEAHGCRGTFFLLGSAVAEHPQIVAALAAAGHELGNHLWSHGDPEQQSRAALRDELDRAAQAIAAAAGAPPVLLRPPYCGAPRHVARAAGRGGAKLVVLRSVDPADWSAQSPEEIVERVLSAVQPGDIVCMHDGIAPGNTGTDSRAATVEAVRRLVPALLARGLRPVTVSELLA